MVHTPSAEKENSDFVELDSVATATGSVVVVPPPDILGKPIKK